MSFDKTRYQLTFFPLQPSVADNANQGNWSVQRESHFISFLNLCEFKGVGANILVKEFVTKGQNKITLNNF